MKRAWQTTIRISGTERLIDEWLADRSFPNLERLMSAVTALDGPVLDLDGMCLPKICGETVESELQCDTLHALTREIEWRSSIELGDEPKAIYPGRYRRFRLEASYRSRIEGADARAIQQHLRLEDEVEWRGKRGSPDRPRSRSVDRVVSQGDRDWARLGAWPYAIYGEQRMPADWRSRTETVEALADYVNVARQDHVPV